MRLNALALSLLLLPFQLFAQAAPTASQPAPQPTRPGNNFAIPRSNAPSQPVIPHQFNSNFAGHWVGTLSYRDYSAKDPNAPRVKLPTDLVATATPDGRAINLVYTYDDGPLDRRNPAGPRKIVTERTILAFTGATALLTGTGSAQNQMFQMAGTQAFAKNDLGTLILTGPGQENDKPVDMRLTLTLTPTAFTWLKETRPAGTPGDFLFRDEYTLTRQ